MGVSGDFLSVLIDIDVVVDASNLLRSRSCFELWTLTLEGFTP